MTRDEWYEIFDSKALQVLDALYQHNEMTYSELRDYVGGSTTTVYRKIEILMRNGLIKETQQRVFPFKRVFRIWACDRNWRVANAIQLIKKEMRGQGK